jgi:hypothetical protein
MNQHWHQQCNELVVTQKMWQTDSNTNNMINQQ